MTYPFNRDPTAVYGSVVRLGPQVRRITAPNPSPMTFTGTQTYLAGEGDVAVIDPGPHAPEHLKAIVDGLDRGERIAAILVTHTHIDHSPGAAALKAMTGAPVYAFGRHGAGVSTLMAGLAASGADLGGGEGADAGFSPDAALADDEALEVGETRLRALHTPGHLSNHLCFALETGPGAGAVFTGDLVMGWATTMVSPPDGDMASFMASLARMSGRDDRVFYGGHGHPVDDPQAMIAHQTAHRRAREGQIVDALRSLGEAAPMTLTRLIYHDVDPALHPAAARNVFATLLGLVAENRAEAEGAIGPETQFRML